MRKESRDSTGPGPDGPGTTQVRTKQPTIDEYKNDDIDYRFRQCIRRDPRTISSPWWDLGYLVLDVQLFQGSTKDTCKFKCHETRSRVGLPIKKFLWKGLTGLA